MSRQSIVLLVFLLAAASAIAQTSRIGTFDQQAIVVAFYRSPLWAETLKEKQRAFDNAQKANDSAKMKELNAWGGESQELAEKQLAGEAPITNIIEALQPAFQEIEKTDNLSAVVPAPAVDSRVQAIDVTDKLLDWLKASQSTRRVIQGLHKQ